MSKIIPIILSGGYGERLWPLSRKQFPKQYLALSGEKTMLQETILRLNGLDNILDPIILCNEDNRFLVLQQCKQINLSEVTILLEPLRKNTAPAIAAAAFQTIKDNPDAILLVLPADHTIKNIGVLHKAIKIAAEHAIDGKLVTFGIVPKNPNTGYGYINVTQEKINGAFTAKKFVEKPDSSKAKSYINKGDYFWNSGMFMFKADILLDQLNIYAPDITDSVSKALKNSEKDNNFVRLEKKSFSLSPNASIDYALMEKSNKVAVIPLDAGWSDIGSWSALYDYGKKDDNRNVVSGDVINIDSKNSFINANNHLVATIGVENLIIVDTPDAILISSYEKAHEVKNVVSQLKKVNRFEASNHRKVFRPWGWFDTIETGKHFQVKKLHIYPGAKLSLQMHKKRAEHWVVVSGQATAINGNEIFTLAEGESTYIPLGVTHSLENKTSDPLEIIEVQSGSYLGEDDIIRFEDIYGRVDK